MKNNPDEAKKLISEYIKERGNNIISDKSNPTQQLIKLKTQIDTIIGSSSKNDIKFEQ